MSVTEYLLGTTGLGLLHVLIGLLLILNGTGVVGRAKPGSRPPLVAFGLLIAAFGAFFVFRGLTVK